MLERVKHQSARFWTERQLPEPDWWARLPLVPFRELCPDELTQAVHKFLARQAETLHAATSRMHRYDITDAVMHNARLPRAQAEVAKRRIEAALERRR